MPKFSIICPHYQPSISFDRFKRGIRSLQRQLFLDFEVIVYHDGPQIREDYIPPDDRFRTIVTSERADDWGHSNRDRGIREATGDYIVHFNPDNVLYSDALYRIRNKIEEEGILYQEDNSIVIFPIYMVGMQYNGRGLWREKGRENIRALFSGHPTILNNIDCMQLVMKRDLWLKEGGWYDTSEVSDGIMYPKFVSKYGARYCEHVLGEHW